ncbi:MAG: hypothetical protein NC417_11450 [Candidatus Gastranaerophilales bacterium]|nr:hypothetical protein [Candidatus Gastranaerophilales bacterium]
MGKIVCLMGKSSTGKDTLYKELLKQDQVALNAIVPYTTRPIRDGETEGVEYHFTDEKGYQELLSRGVIVEERSYHTCHGVWRYFMVDDGTLCLDRESYLLIGTLEAYTHMREYFGVHRLLPVLVELDDGIRLQRALDREKIQEQPRYEELCRRFLADSADFAKEKVEAAGIVRTFHNDDFPGCLREIISYIKENV